MDIAFVSPTPEEGRPLSRILKRISGHPFALHYGNIKGKRVLLAISGIGKTNAATATTYIIERFSPDSVILFGVGGAYPSTGLSIGDVALAEREFYGDEGVLMMDGFQGMEIIGIPLIKRGQRRLFNEFSLDNRLLSFVKNVVKGQVKSGNFVTLSSITGTKERAMELKRRFNAIVENMEGAAVAHVCEVFRKGFVEIRGISNIVENRDPSKWDLKAGIRAYRDLLFNIINEFP